MRLAVQDTSANGPNQALENRGFVTAKEPPGWATAGYG
jgi:hypothetical protein